jgi:hypothetical protein
MTILGAEIPIEASNTSECYLKSVATKVKDLIKDRPCFIAKLF